MVTDGWQGNVDIKKKNEFSVTMVLKERRQV